MAGPLIGRRPVLAGLAAAPLLMGQGAPRPIEPLDERVSSHLGIRYGRADRFRAPQPGTGQADGYGPGSPQRGAEGSEDCLFLNLWRPRGEARRPRPVLAYLHGGAYSTGGANHPWLDGRALAARGDVVVITVGHRLNAFGYLYLGRIDPRFADSGNAGQLDLVLALRWIQYNVAGFGGDPGNVTLFGQSGGGAKIATLMGMEAAAGLFHKAMTMSGQQVTVSGPQHATERTRAFMRAVGARTVDDLLAMPAARLVEGLAADDPIQSGSLYFGPVLDMKWLTRHPFWPDAHPVSRRIPLLLGNTRDETRAFFPPGHRTLSGLSWDNLAARLGPELRVDAHPEWVVAEYRRLFPAYGPEQVFIAATTAGRSWRAQLIEAEERARAGAPAFVYQLNHPDPAPHTADIPLVFGTFTNPADRPVSEAVMDALLRFARTGNPGWPAYTLPARRTMIFERAPHVESDPRRAERELFARIPYIQPGT